MNKPRLQAPLEPAIDQRAPRNAAQMWRNVERLRERRRQGKRAPYVARRWLLLAASFALIAGTALGAQQLLQLDAPPVAPLATAESEPLPVSIVPVTQHASLDLSDGSRITVARGAHLDVLDSSGRNVALALREGRARFDIRPRGPRTWRVDCGVLSVEVVGTAFVIEREAGRVRVEVLRGAVLVRGEGVPDGVARLDKGQSFESDETRADSPASETVKAQSEQPPEKPQGGEPSDAPAASVPLEPASALRAALLPTGDSGSAAATLAPEPAGSAARVRAGKNSPDLVRSARAAVGRAGQGGDARSASGAGESVVAALFREADEARRHGRPEQARAALQTITTEHTRDPRAALAAYALARLELGQLASPARAVDNLRLALSLGLPSALREGAQAALVRAHEQAEQWQAACAARDEYQRRFPRGHTLREAPAQCRIPSRD